MGQLLDSARSGRGRVLALVGEPGIGKSALLDRACEQAADMRVLRARGVQSESHIPFAGLAELLRPALFLLDRLPGPQAEALQGGLALIPSRSQDRFAIGSATLSLLVAYAESGPVVVAVDDAQWIDGSSADALAFAFRRLVADPVAVLVAVRAGEASLLAGTAIEQIELAGLDLARASELVTAVAGPVPGSLLGRLHRDTGGNPLALVEAARQVDFLRRHSPLDTPLPIVTSVSQIHLVRIRSLGQGAAAVLLIAAASDLTDLAVLARAANALGADVADLAEAEDARLVTVGDGSVEFAHPLIRSAVYNDASPDRRRKAHRALAGALPDREADRRAWHLAQAALGPDPLACSALKQAAERALERNAYEVAARAFERSSQLAGSDGSRTELLYQAARCGWDAGLPDRAIALIDQAEQLGADESVSVALEHLRGQIVVGQGPVAAGLAHLLNAAQRSAPTSPEAAVVILAEAVRAAFYAGDAATMLKAAHSVNSLQSRVVSERAIFFAAMAEGMAYSFCGETGTGARRLHDAIDIAVTVVAPDDPDWHAWTRSATCGCARAGASRACWSAAQS